MYKNQENSESKHNRNVWGFQDSRLEKSDYDISSKVKASAFNWIEICLTKAVRATPYLTKNKPNLKYVVVS